MASPHVAGLAALLKSFDKTLSPANIEQLISASSTNNNSNWSISTLSSESTETSTSSALNYEKYNLESFESNSGSNYLSQDQEVIFLNNNSNKFPNTNIQNESSGSINIDINPSIPRIYDESVKSVEKSILSKPLIIETKDNDELDQNLILFTAFAGSIDESKTTVRDSLTGKLIADESNSDSLTARSTNSQQPLIKDNNSHENFNETIVDKLSLKESEIFLLDSSQNENHLIGSRCNSDFAVHDFIDVNNNQVIVQNSQFIGNDLINVLTPKNNLV